jgi:hypothetical protein
MQVFYNDKAAQEILNNVDRWLKSGIKDAAHDALVKVQGELEENWASGETVEGHQMTPVRDSTMDMPISYSKDRRIRRTVNPNREKPLWATGRTAEGHVVRRTTDGAELINPDYNAQMILGVNSKATHNRARRDPLAIGKNTEALVASELLKHYDKKVGV